MNNITLYLEQLLGWPLGRQVQNMKNYRAELITIALVQSKITYKEAFLYSEQLGLDRTYIFDEVYNLWSREYERAVS